MLTSFKTSIQASLQNKTKHCWFDECGKRICPKMFSTLEHFNDAVEFVVCNNCVLSRSLPETCFVETFCIQRLQKVVFIGKPSDFYLCSNGTAKIHLSLCGFGNEDQENWDPTKAPKINTTSSLVFDMDSYSGPTRYWFREMPCDKLVPSSVKCWSSTQNIQQHEDVCDVFDLLELHFSSNENLLKTRIVQYALQRLSNMPTEWYENPLTKNKQFPRMVQEFTMYLTCARKYPFDIDNIAKITRSFLANIQEQHVF